MTADIKCPYCKTEYTIDHSELGHTVNCEVCGKQFVATVSTKIQDVPQVRANTTRNNVRVVRGTIDQKPKGLSGETWLKRKTRLAIIGAYLEIVATTLGILSVFPAWRRFWREEWLFGPRATCLLLVMSFILSLIGWILIAHFFHALYKRQ